MTDKFIYSFINYTFHKFYFPNNLTMFYDSYKVDID